MKKNLLSVLLVAATTFSLAACGSNNGGGGSTKEGTAGIVEEASKMTLAQLEEASKKEMEATDTPFYIIGLTSALGKAASTFAKKYEWIHYGEEGVADNVRVKNDYKDYTLLTALESADESYVADYALVQDERSLADYARAGLLHNFIPSDWQELGLSEADTKKPLKGIHFNKLFYTNTNFQNKTGKTLNNIWQLAGTSEDANHLDNVSFQTPVTEQINMSFLLSAMAPSNQERILSAYKDYYGKDWEPSQYWIGDDVKKKLPEKAYTYVSAGEQWVREFVANISRWHGSDGTAMKETQLKDDWDKGYVYYGAFAKMKDAVGKEYAVNIGENVVDGEVQPVNAMYTVKWDWEIKGFNGFMYTMDSQIVNNAKHPYTACLYARTLLTLDAYKGMIYNKDLPGADDTVTYSWNTTGHKIADVLPDHGKVNQYGYYFPGSNDITYAKGDWTRDQHIAKELYEDYDFLKTIKGSQVNTILAMVSENKKVTA